MSSQENGGVGVDVDSAYVQIMFLDTWQFIDDHL